MNGHAVQTIGAPRVATTLETVAWLGGYALLLLAIYVSGVKPIGISADLRNYELLYNASAISDWWSIFQGSDFGYFGLAKLAAWLGWSFDLFAFVLAAVTCVLLYAVFTRIDTNRPLLVAIYASYLFWLHSYTQIRIAAALAIGLFAIYVSRPAMRWPLLVLGILLHNSFILLVFAYALVKVRRMEVLAALAAVALFLLVGPLSSLVEGLVQRIITYQDLASSTGQFAAINLFSLMPLVQVVGIGCAVVHFRNLPTAAREETFFSIVGVLAFYAASSVPVLAFRTFELFMPFFVILLSRLSQRSIFIWGVILVWVLLGVRSSFLTPDSVVIL